MLAIAKYTLLQWRLISRSTVLNYLHLESLNDCFVGDLFSFLVYKI